MSEPAKAAEGAEGAAPGRYWNYRVMEFTQGEETWRALHEVHYENGKPVGFSETPATLMWDVAADNAEAVGMLARMKEALEKPVLREADFWA